ncbi:hypothetical protein CERZMDRAFT_99116 [Cercospora zeae-maydis SCOH1-5]|uniref:Uncharacterized protein n=1 Tax=Cercospora zeae-maydis SCOH1-5 TaxID=717836 RepID=A0A6A6FC12_9PEZI|nr:hypothetical protein CERZMDRAFT_99116 [Cercospora zeae-maydis SCOH1-5]
MQARCTGSFVKLQVYISPMRDLQQAIPALALCQTSLDGVAFVRYTLTLIGAADGPAVTITACAAASPEQLWTEVQRTSRSTTQVNGSRSRQSASDFAP